MINLLDIKHLTPATAEKGDSQGKIISFGKIHDYLNFAVELTLTSERCVEKFFVYFNKVFSISDVLFLVSSSFRVSSSEIFCLRDKHMVTIPMTTAKKKTANKAKNGMLPEELNNVKLDMM